uniref:Uncharacterized protein n=1 Tax=Glossina palpalis gambiensis TaxID=67801 RepID=A0A1B0C3U9_9MUSC
MRLDRGAPEHFTDHWLYWFTLILGGVVTAVLWRYVLKDKSFETKGQVIESARMSGLDMCLKIGQSILPLSEKMPSVGLYVNSSPALRCCAWQASCLTAAIV